MAMGTGGAYVQTIKVNMNNKSSTKAKLVEVYDVPNQVMWTWYLPKDQGYKIHDNIIYQEKQSAIKL